MARNPDSLRELRRKVEEVVGCKLWVEFGSDAVRLGNCFRFQVGATLVGSLVPRDERLVNAWLAGFFWLAIPTVFGS